MPCELTPVILELFDKAILRNEFLFEVTFGMNVNNDGQSTVEDHLQRTVEIPQIIRRNSVGLSAPEHRLGIHAQPHVIESHRFNERDILRGIPRFKVFLGVALLVVNLRKPLAQINSMAQMLCVTLRNARL